MTTPEFRPSTPQPRPGGTSGREPSQTRRLPFRQAVAVAQPVTGWVWGLRDWVTLALIPAILGGAALVTGITQTMGLASNPSVAATADTVLRLAICVILVLINKKMLAEHWRAFRRAAWRSWGLVVLAMVAFAQATNVAKMLITMIDPSPVVESAGMAGKATVTDLPIVVGLFISLGPLVTPLIEEFVFRHTLMMRLPVWSSKVTLGVAVILNSLLFGAIHINNFGGNLLYTLSYAAAGLVMSLLYMWTRNIWHVLLAHTLLNFLVGGPQWVLFAHLLAPYVG